MRPGDEDTKGDKRSDSCFRSCVAACKRLCQTCTLFYIFGKTPKPSRCLLDGWRERVAAIVLLATFGWNIALNTSNLERSRTSPIASIKYYEQSELKKWGLVLCQPKYNLHGGNLCTIPDYIFVGENATQVGAGREVHKVEVSSGSYQFAKYAPIPTVDGEEIFPTLAPYLSVCYDLDPFYSSEGSAYEMTASREDIVGKNENLIFKFGWVNGSQNFDPKGFCHVLSLNGYVRSSSGKIETAASRSAFSLQSYTNIDAWNKAYTIRSRIIEHAKIGGTIERYLEIQAIKQGDISTSKVVDNEVATRYARDLFVEIHIENPLGIVYTVQRIEDRISFGWSDFLTATLAFIGLLQSVFFLFFTIDPYTKAFYFKHGKRAQILRKSFNDKFPMLGSEWTKMSNPSLMEKKMGQIVRESDTNVSVILRPRVEKRSPPHRLSVEGGDALRWKIATHKI
eukprot:jgi/Bigna1/69801/fgenesh1_pg.10_\